MASLLKTWQWYCSRGRGRWPRLRDRNRHGPLGRDHQGGTGGVRGRRMDQMPGLATQEEAAEMLPLSGA